MELIALFFVFVVIVYVATEAEREQAEKLMADKKKKCPPHQWKYDQNDRLECAVCQMRPSCVRRGEE